MRKAAARGPAGPYTVERGIDRDTYHDGPRTLSDFWNARPYADVESPHQDADADLDAERPSRPINRVMINEETIRNLVSSVLKTAQGDDEGESIGEGGEYEPGTQQFTLIAPFMDYVADLMQGYASKKELASALASSSFPGFDIIEELVERAEKAGFGYTDTKKDYDALRRMVNASGDLILDPGKRKRIIAALRGAQKAGLFKRFGFLYAGAPDKIGFKPNPHGWKVSDTPEQIQFYDPAEIAKRPEVQTRYVNYILDFLGGKDITGRMQKQLEGQGIINIAQGQFSVKRLSAVMRFMVERPDTVQAAALMVGLMLKDTLGQLDLESHIDKETGRINISPSQIIQNMSGNTKSLADRWIRSAVAILKMAGMMPEGEDYESAREKILQSAIRTAVSIANPLVGSMMNRFQAEQAAAEQAEREKMQQMNVRQPASQPEGQPPPSGHASSRDAELVSADVLKEITGPTRLRIVTPEEAEEGIEVDDERKLKFRRSRYHAVSGMLARCGGD